MSLDICKEGHAYNKANTYHRKDGSRQCRACANIYQKGRRDAVNKIMKAGLRDKKSLGVDRANIAATCQQIDALLPGSGNLVKRLRFVMQHHQYGKQR